MFFQIKFYFILLTVLIKSIKSLPLTNDSKIILDQRQNGKYNIHLSIKDVSIIQIGGSDYEEYSDNDDYYYDDAMLTIKPLGTSIKPSSESSTVEAPLFNSILNESQNGVKINYSSDEIKYMPDKQSSENENLTQSTSMNAQNLIYSIETTTFRPSQRNPLDFVHYRTSQKTPESKIFNFRPISKSKNNRRRAKQIKNCINVTKKERCSLSKRMNSLLLAKLLTWVKKSMPEE